MTYPVKCFNSPSVILISEVKKFTESWETGALWNQGKSEKTPSTNLGPLKSSILAWNKISPNKCTHNIKPMIATRSSASSHYSSRSTACHSGRRERRPAAWHQVVSQFTLRGPSITCHTGRQESYPSAVNQVISLHCNDLSRRNTSDRTTYSTEKARSLSISDYEDPLTTCHTENATVTTLDIIYFDSGERRIH